MVSSSSPSPPCTTRPWLPRAAKTPAISSAIRGSATPTAWAIGCAGLAKGPEEVERRRDAELASRGPRAAAPGGSAGRTGSRCRPGRPPAAEPRGVRSSTTPSASSTSAAPQAEDAARLPCLTTLAPAAAATIAAMVEMLTVFDRSPPEPTTSTAGPPISIGVANRASCRPGRSAPRPSRPCCAARRRTPPAGPASPRRSESAPSPRPWPRRAGPRPGPGAPSTPASSS